jgi:hypothetical protein
MLVLPMILLSMGITLYSMKNLATASRKQPTPIVSETIQEYVHIAVLNLYVLEHIMTELLEYIKNTPPAKIAVQFIFPNEYDVNVVMYAPRDWVNSTKHSEALLQIEDFWKDIPHTEYEVVDGTELVNDIIASEWRLKHESENYYKTDFNTIRKANGKIPDINSWNKFINKEISDHGMLINKEQLLQSLAV